VNNSSIKITLEIFEEYEEVTFYTFFIENESFSETEKFIINHSESKVEEIKEDFDVIIRLIERIGQTGAEERHFRRVSKPNDKAAAMPGYQYEGNGIEVGDLRLYVIHLNKNIVILGNGGIKTTEKYNEDPILDGYVDMVVRIYHKLSKKIHFNDITIESNKLKGNLRFTI
jgi:hypothetical protein